MKKFLSILVCLTLILSALFLVGCNDKNDGKDTENEEESTKAKEETLKLGLGIVTSTAAESATEEKNGNGQATMTAAAVLVDKDGKIVKAFVDCADSTVSHTIDGKAVATESFKTKYELGNDYNMKLYGGAAKEWYEQAAAFDAACAGKTASEITALAVNGKGNSDLQSAGCTIYITDFVKAAAKIG